MAGSRTYLSCIVISMHAPADSTAQDIYHLWLSDDPSELNAHLLVYFPTEWPVPGESALEKVERVGRTWRGERMHADKDKAVGASARDEPEDGPAFSSSQWCLAFLRSAAEWTKDRATYCRGHG